MRQHLLTLLNYNVWANKRILDVVKNIDQRLLDTEVKSSFNSLRKTIFHTWDAELIWFSRIKGNPLEYFPSSEYSPQTPVDGFVQNSFEFENFMQDKDDLFLQSVCHYRNTQKKEFSNKVFEMAFHCMNHSTFHRGQMITIFRNLSITELKSTDLITYYREKQA